MIDQVIAGIDRVVEPGKGAMVVAGVDVEDPVPVEESGPAASPRPATSRPGRAGVRTQSVPPSPRVRARDELTAQSLARRGGIVPDSDEAVIAERLWERQGEQSRAHARMLADLAGLWVEGDHADLADDREEMDLVVAIAQRTTTGHAATQLRDAHIAVTDLPATFARLAAGVMPAEWFDRLVRAVRGLTAIQRGQVDQRIASWDLASIPADRFRRELRLLVAWFTSRAEQPAPEQLRDVALEVAPEADGTACVRVTGPVPELVAFTRRLDQSARAVQDQQRRALAAGSPVPFDPEGTAGASGRPLPLAALQYAVMTGSVLETGGIEVPAERFRINVVVPVMTLLGVSDAPATLDGATPIPPAMARRLAAGDPSWYRVLTDPATGAFLPLPAQRYRPTTAMLEHLRLRDPVCAAPGCDRLTSSNSEADHIIAFNHQHPDRGGRTHVAQMHLLCRTHHRLKTRGLLQPTRPDPPRRPGRGASTGATDQPTAHRDRPDHGDGAITNWLVTKSIRIQAAADRDLLTPDLAAALQESWQEHLWHREIQALADNGEIARFAREEGPIDDPTSPPTRARPPY